MIEEDEDSSEVEDGAANEKVIVVGSADVASEVNSVDVASEVEDVVSAIVAVGIENEDAATVIIAVVPASETVTVVI